MLKIKDNLDLKELEKFGFELEQSLDTGKYYYTNATLFIDNRIIKQMDYNNKFYAIDYNFDYYDIMVLYDLMQAGLVEKAK